MKSKVFYLIALLILTSCFNSKTKKEKTLYGTWRLHDIVENGKPKPGDSFSREANLKKIVKEGGMISFFSDTSYSEININGKFRTGSWKMSNDFTSLSLIDSGYTSEPIGFTIEDDANGKQELALSIPKKNRTIKFMKESDLLPEINDDPFYPANNLWRQKPLQPEDTIQLTRRLANYFKHVALILKAAKIRELKIVSFEFSQGPIKIYNGGIGIHPYEIVPDKWKHAFYDESNAMTTYNLYKNYLRKSNYKGASTGNWIEDDYNILLNMYADITETPNSR